MIFALNFPVMEAWLKNVERRGGRAEVLAKAPVGMIVTVDKAAKYFLLHIGTDQRAWKIQAGGVWPATAETCNSFGTCPLPPAVHVSVE